MPSSCVPPPPTPNPLGEKRSGKRSRIPWAYSPTVVPMRLRDQSLLRSTSLTTVKNLFISVRVSVPFLSGLAAPKQFDFVHQTVSPRERVGSGDDTSYDSTVYDLTLSSPMMLYLRYWLERLTLLTSLATDHTQLLKP